VTRDDPAADRYERSDVETRPVVIMAFALALLVGGSLAVSALLDRRLTRELQSRESVSPLRELRETPGGPELQSIPARELEEHHAWEERLLSATEWVDSVNGIVRIPVDQAFELSLREGFPARTGTAQEKK